MTNADREKLAKDLVAAAYLRGHFVLRSGKTSNYYFDKYLFETRPDLLGGVASLIADMLPSEIDRLAGPELGAVALAAAVSLASGVPFVIVRKEQKDYGTNKAIEGVVNPGERVVLVEDVLTTGGEALRSAGVLKDAGVNVVGIIGVVDREEGAEANATAAGYPLQAVFRRSELEAYLS
jgi:orotate phosphoribosyltransferase